MRPALLVLPLAILAACASPREQCIGDATRETRVLTNLVSETQANITRGYALREVQELRTVRSTCEGRNADGTTFRFACDETDTVTRLEPVAIDLNAERAKLVSLQERLAQVRATSDQRVAQCIAANPE